VGKLLGSTLKGRGPIVYNEDKMKTEILYEDADVIVIRKLAGFPTESAKATQLDVVSELRNYLSTEQNKKPYIGVVHRLDRPVEGLLVFAKNKKAAAGLTKQLEEGSLNKQYYAVAFNQPSVQEGVLEDYLIKDPVKKVAKVVTADTEGAQKASLRYRVVAGIQGRVLYAIRIDTGRFHQIRVQMAHAGMPLLGDQKYADEATKIYAKHLGIRNVALCAFQVGFVHPVNGKKLVFTTLPRGEAFQPFVDLIGKTLGNRPL